MVSPITDLKFVTIIVNNLNFICEQLEKNMQVIYKAVLELDLLFI